MYVKTGNLLQVVKVHNLYYTISTYNYDTMMYTMCVGFLFTQNKKKTHGPLTAKIIPKKYDFFYLKKN